MRCGKDMPLIKSQLGLMSKLLVAGSQKPEIVSCGGVGVVVLKTLDKMLSSKFGLHHPFSIYALHVEKLLKKPSYSVMGQVDMLALLKLLLPKHVDCLDFMRMLSTQWLCRFVRILL